jgi:hypothetical protein
VVYINAYVVLVGRCKGGGLLGRPWHGWKDNIDVDLKEIGRVVVDWIIWLKMEKICGPL